MKKLISYAVLVMMIAASLCGCSGNLDILSSNDEAVASSVNPNADGIFAASLVKLSGEYTINVRYPVTGKQSVDECIRKLIDEQIQAFLKREAELGAPSDGIPEGKSELYIDYELQKFDENTLSVYLEIYWYVVGMAHGVNECVTRTFDMQGGNAVELSGLFNTKSYLDTLSELSFKHLTESGQLGDYYDEAWLKEGTAPKEENFRCFLLTPDALDIIFPQYQIGPGALGTQSISIPLSELGDILDDKWK